MTVGFRISAPIAGAIALLFLTGCSAAPAGSTTDPGTDGALAPVAEPVTACPDGFVEAFTSASAFAFDSDLVVTEVAVDAFDLAFLAPFLDGGCALHVSGTQKMSFGDLLIEVDYGFAPDAAIAAAIAEALSANGYTEDPSFPGQFQSDDGSRSAGVFAIGGEVVTTGYTANEKFYPDGVVFFG